MPPMRPSVSGASVGASERSTQDVDGRRFHRPERRPGVVVDEVGDQLEKVDNAYQCRAAGAKADRPVAGSQEVGPQSVHCRSYVRGRADALDPVGQRRAHSSDLTAQFVVVPRGKKEQRRRHAYHHGDQPTQQPLADWPDRCADRPDLRQQDRALTGGHRRTGHTGQCHRHAEEKHERHREPGNGGGAVNQVNVHLAVETMPFGGVGMSGMGR